MEMQSLLQGMVCKYPGTFPLQKKKTIMPSSKLTSYLTFSTGVSAMINGLFSLFLLLHVCYCSLRTISIQYTKQLANWHGREQIWPHPSGSGSAQVTLSSVSVSSLLSLQNATQSLHLVECSSVHQLFPAQHWNPSLSEQWKAGAFHILFHC